MNDPHPPHSYARSGAGLGSIASSASLMQRRTVLAMAALSGIAAPAAGRALSSRSSATRIDPSRSTAVAIPDGNRVFGVTTGSFDKYGYSPAVRANGLLFIAGQVGLRPDGTVPVSAAEQADWALKRIAEILRLEGLSLKDLVDVTSYHVDLAGNIDGFLAVKQRYTPKPHPTWSIIGIEALTRPGLKIEIQALASSRPLAGARSGQ